MNTLEVIAARRSIRAFKATPVPEDSIRTILTAAIQAPSSKNRQPWRFTVVPREKMTEIIRIFRQEIAGWKAQGLDTGSCEQTANIMEQAPVTIFVFYPDGLPQSEDGIGRAVVDMQAIGAAIQNMLLAAQHLGLGTLWIADILPAAGKLYECMDEEPFMAGAVSLGYPDQNSPARPRKPLDEVVRWVLQIQKKAGI